MTSKNIENSTAKDILLSGLYNMPNSNEIIKYLIEAGAKVDTTDKNGNATPLCYAVMTNNIDAAKVLFERGANPNMVIPKTGNTPTDTLALHLNNSSGLMNKADEWIKLFLDNKANFHKVSENKLKTTPLDKLSDEGRKAYDNIVAIFYGNENNKPKV
jgi:ankyrin repeat protein